MEKEIKAGFECPQAVDGVGRKNTVNWEHLEGEKEADEYNIKSGPGALSINWAGVSNPLLCF